jgi:transcription elongation GreA/GreB family factor
LLEKGQADRVMTLGPMVLEALPADVDPRGVVAAFKVFLAAEPESADWRKRTADAYRRAYGAEAGFEALLTASGMLAGRPHRVAAKVLDFGLELAVGSFLLSRTEDRVAEVAALDRPNALVTLRFAAGNRTLPLAELARGYDLVAADDFRVLRQLHPERLPILVENDPVVLVMGLIHAHGGRIDQETLKSELVPRYLDAKAWTKWWSATRTQVKRSPHVLIEGRSPVVLSYSAAGRTLEDEAREAFDAARDPDVWRTIIEGYLRDKHAHKETPDAGLLAELTGRLVAHLGRVQMLRPTEALETALVLERLKTRGVPLPDGAEGEAVVLLRTAPKPTEMIAGLRDADLWDSALDALRVAKPEPYAAMAAGLMGRAPAAALDRLAQDAVAGGQTALAQDWIERALDAPHELPEIICWLWKGPKGCEGLHLPNDNLLFDEIMDTFLAMGRTLNPPPDVVRNFRQRMRTALAYRDYAKVRACFQASDYSRGVTLKGELTRVEGLGDVLQAALVKILREVHSDLWVVVAARALELWEDPNVVWSTDAGIRRRGTEQAHLVNVTMHENAKRIGEAGALGDLSENSEYKFALEERDLLRARLAQMNAELSMARPLEPALVRSDRVGIGARVTLRCPADGHERMMTFLGPFDSDVSADIFNYRAPLSQKLMGKRIGERVTLTLDGQDIEYEVTALANALSNKAEG